MTHPIEEQHAALDTKANSVIRRGLALLRYLAGYEDLRLFGEIFLLLAGEEALEVFLSSAISAL